MIGTFTGRTLRVTASNFRDAGGAVVTDPDDIAITLEAPDGTAESGAVIQDGATWYADFTPDDPGSYRARIVANKNATVWEERETVVVQAW